MAVSLGDVKILGLPFVSNMATQFNNSPQTVLSTTEHVMQTVTLREDGDVVSEQLTKREASPPFSLYRSIGENRDHSIYDYLSRPVKIDSGTWSTGEPGTILKYWSFPDALFKSQGDSNVQNQNISKVRGFVGFKARVRVRVQINSQPFQAGALLLSYVPYAQYMKSHSRWLFNTDPGVMKTNLVSGTACPSVILNICNGTSFEFVTPYISPYLYANLVTGEGTFGNIYLSILSTLSTGTGSSSINYVVLANFEDIELRYPTIAEPVTLFAQSGGEMQEMESKGVVSSGVRTVGTAVMNMLPTLGMSSLVRPVDYVTNTMSSILKIFGYSKPAITAPVTRVLQSPARYFLNSDGSYSGHKLALTSTNELQNFSGFAGTDIDEMSFANVCGRSTFLKEYEWKTGDAANDLIEARVVSPASPASTSTVVLNSIAYAVDIPPYTRVASYFAQWRGDFVYTLRFVKTQFHSGRLRIAFAPYVYNITKDTLPANYAEELGYTYTEDVDLAVTSEFSFRVPFVSTRPWLNVYGRIPTTLTDLKHVSPGTLYITVLNPLVAPSTVSSTIKILAFAHMENAQFSCPLIPPIVPYKCPNIAQVGLEVVKQHSEIDDVHNIDLAPPLACTGEVVSSYRQLLKTFQLLPPFTTAAVTSTLTTRGSTGTSMLLYPWAPATPENEDIITPTAAPWDWSPALKVNDYYSLAYQHYAFFRGSMRYALYIPSTGVRPTVYVQMITFSTGESSVYRPNQTPNSSADTSNLTVGPFTRHYDLPRLYSGSGAPSSFFESGSYVARTLPVIYGIEGLVEFEVPYYSTGHMTPTNYSLNNDSTVRRSIAPLPIVLISNLAPGTTVTPFRACGDDFEFGCRLGVPRNIFFYKAPLGPSDIEAPILSRRGREVGDTINNSGESMNFQTKETEELENSENATVRA